MALTSGTKLGPYEIRSGGGGMGEVYRARDTRLDRFVAVKILHSQLACTPELKMRFDREARTLSSLSHPHICSLYDVGKEGLERAYEGSHRKGLSKGAVPRVHRRNFRHTKDAAAGVGPLIRAEVGDTIVIHFMTRRPSPTACILTVFPMSATLRARPILIPAWMVPDSFPPARRTRLFGTCRSARVRATTTAVQWSGFIIPTIGNRRTSRLA